MNTLNHSHLGNSLHNYLEFLSGSLDSPVIDDCVWIPPGLGEGFVKDCFIEEGFVLRYFHFKLTRDLYFEWTNPKEVEAIFTLVLHIQAPGEQKESGSDRIKGNTEANIAELFSTDFSRSGIIKNGTPVRRLVLLFTKQWLQENFEMASDQIAKFVCLMVATHQPLTLQAPLTKNEIEVARELVQAMQEEHCPLIRKRTLGLAVLQKFLEKLIRKQEENIARNRYTDLMVQIQKKLKEHLDKPMPELSTLARSFHITVPTLQRQFKKVFGKNIQEYYLEIKMAKGMELIFSKSKTVSETAYLLGYSKINSFSKAFRKRYGVLPKEVKEIKNYH